MVLTDESLTTYIQVSHFWMRNNIEVNSMSDSMHGHFLKAGLEVAASAKTNFLLTLIKSVRVAGNPRQAIYMIQPKRHDLCQDQVAPGE